MSNDMVEPAIYRIELDQQWSLADLYEFPRTYAQAYAFLYSVLSRGAEAAKTWDMESEDVDEPYVINPWVGGYDAVNFYKQLQSRVPRAHRPQVVSLHYGSPGWMDLGLLMAIAVAIRLSVASFVGAGRQLNSFYNEIYKGMRERQLMNISVKRQQLSLDREALEFIESSTLRLAELLEVRQAADLHLRTKNPLASLRIMLSYYRRVRTLAEYSKRGKAKL